MKCSVLVCSATLDDDKIIRYQNMSLCGPCYLTIMYLEESNVELGAR